jgi:hypothetical protein
VHNEGSEQPKVASAPLGASWRPCTAPTPSQMRQICPIRAFAAASQRSGLEHVDRDDLGGVGHARFQWCQSAGQFQSVCEPRASHHVLWLTVMANGLPQWSDWDGLIRDRVDPSDGPSLAVMMGPAGGSWSSPIQVTADDNLVYFAKFPELCGSQQDQMSVVTEMVVAEAGQLIGASTCRTVVMRVPSQLQGDELKNGVRISSSVVHASLALNNCVEVKTDLPDRGRDDNRRRHVGLYALYDWFIGADQQWLRDLDDDMATYSHDHGMYLPPAGAGHWTEQDLQANVDQAHPPPGSTTGLSAAAISETAAALRSVDRGILRSLLNRVPSSWAVTDAQLECLGWFLERRAPAVAGRIELVSS